MAVKKPRKRNFAREIRKISRQTQSTFIDRDLGHQAMYDALQGIGSQSLHEIGIIEESAKTNENGTNVLEYAFVLELRKL